MGIEVYCEFVNNYFGGINFSDFSHPQKYKKASEQQSEQSGIEQSGVKRSGAKRKAIVIYNGEGLDPASNQDGDSSSSDSESEGVTEVQGHEGGPAEKKNAWYNQFEQVWGGDIDADNDGELFFDDSAIPFMYDVDILFVGMQFMGKADFKKHLRGYAIKKGFQYRLNPYDNGKIKVICKFNKSQDCKFFIWTSVTTGEPTFTVGGLT
ncbi:hypothetical protein MKX01_007272 [Papaver californicum]|nr:hypothetical protein MKX01_007272 [Papaver californicum]